jgi:Phospholipase_D-nuclease N-terminal
MIIARIHFAGSRIRLQGGQLMGTLLGVAATILDIFAISDVMRSRRDWATKVVLIAIILLIPYVGAGLYLFAFRDKSIS